MKISNETKIGILAAITITTLILGYNYLMGRSLFSSNHEFVAVYDNIDGLTPSNPVMLNGYKVGSVKSIKLRPDLKLIVTIEVDNNIPIAKNGIAKISNNDIFGGKAILIEIGSGDLAMSGDTLTSILELSLTKSVSNLLNPVRDKTEKLLASIDTLATNITKIFNPSTNNDIKRSFSDLSGIIANFKETSIKLDKLVGDQNARLNKIFEHVESITRNFRDNNAVLSDALKNIRNITDSLAASDLKTTVNNAKNAINQLNQVLEKINKGEGSLGLLINDKKLYENLQKSSDDLDKLLIDLKEHPKRYLSFSVFGGKDKTKKK